jgi:glycosyltransferase involved in cell wall biosynthesis
MFHQNSFPSEGDNFKTKIEVSIGVCVRNCEKDLRKIVDRISSQDFPHENMEVLFVDDGSEDKTLSEILRIAPQIGISYRVYHHEWKGLGYSRNVALANAGGDYLIWVDDGTIIPRDYVSKHVEFMESNPNVGIARGFIGTYSGSNFVSTLENLVRLSFSYKYAGGATTKLPGAAGSVYRIKAARQVGGFQKDIKGAGEDTDIAYRILKAGWQIFITTNGFLIDYNTEFKQVWKKSFWYGYGAHFTIHKHIEFRDIIYKSSPLGGLIEGVLASFLAYKTTRKKMAFLLPIWYFMIRIAWNIGFISSHFDAYGHIQ